MLRNGFNEAEGRQNEQPDAHMATVSSSGWLETFPPSPYWTDGLRPETGVVYGGRPGGTGAGVSGRTILALAPDGMALGETYVTPDGAQAEILPDDATLARMAYRVEASIVADVDSRGGFPGGDARIRVIGMAAGEADYLGSLSSGVRVAEHLIRSFEVSGDSAREITDLEERTGRNE
jgi:hypothetical protein